MPVRKTPPRKVGITAVPGRVHVSPPYGPDERAALRRMFSSPAPAPLARELEELGGRVGALLGGPARCLRRASPEPSTS